MRDIKLKLDATRKDKHQITSQGFLVVDANLTRAGVFDYHEDGKLVRELRSPEEVFKQESLDSLKFAPLTIQHPESMVDSHNAKRLQVGMVGENISRRGDYVGGKVVITDQNAIDDILAKWDNDQEVELSMGYEADVVTLAGTHHIDGPYDKAQRDIVYNHASVVDRGRAGSNVKLIKDAADAEKEAEKSLKSKKDVEVKRMFKIKRDAVEVGTFKMDSIMEEADDSAKGVVGTLEGHLDGAVDHIVFMQKEKDELQAKHDELDGSAKKLQAKVDELSDPTSAVVQGMIKERADLETVAKSVDVKVDSEDGKSKDSKTLKVDIISSIHPEFKADEKSDDYISARFDAVVEMIEARKDEKSKITLGNFRKDAKDSEGEEKVEPRDKFLKKVDGYHKEKED